MSIVLGGAHIVLAVIIYFVFLGLRLLEVRAVRAKRNAQAAMYFSAYTLMIAFCICTTVMHYLQKTGFYD